MIITYYRMALEHRANQTFRILQILQCHEKIAVVAGLRSSIHAISVSAPELSSNHRTPRKIESGAWFLALIHIEGDIVMR